MLVHREFENLGMKFIETKSDQNLRMKCGNEYMDVAYDPIDDVKDWQETDIPIGTPIPDDTTAYAQAGRILMGVEE